MSVSGPRITRRMEIPKTFRISIDDIIHDIGLLAGRVHDLRWAPESLLLRFINAFIVTTTVRLWTITMIIVSLHTAMAEEFRFTRKEVEQFFIALQEFESNFRQIELSSIRDKIWISPNYKLPVTRQRILWGNERLPTQLLMQNFMESTAVDYWLLSRSQSAIWLAFLFIHIMLVLIVSNACFLPLSPAPASGYWRKKLCTCKTNI